VNKKIILIIAVIIVVGAIGYLEITKPKSPQLNSSKAESIAVKPNSNDKSNLNTSPEPIKQVRIMSLQEKAKKYSPAIEIIPGGQFINSPPFTLKSLIGKKVILVDFWTYTCINCQRTTPYLNAWYAKYKDQGFVIVGVHSPEFEFEKDYNNVLKAVQDMEIKYPVVQDNNYATWRAYGNRFWPREYLIDIDGFIIHDKIGEGGYDETEKVIQDALKERFSVLGLKDLVDKNITNPKNAITMDSSKIQSPETYFGFLRNEYFGNGQRNTSGDQTLLFPNSTSLNTLYLDGIWNFQSEFSESKSTAAKIKFIYNAKNVYFVASSDKGAIIKISQDGALVKTMTIKDYKLYNLIEGMDYGQHTLDIEVDNPGLKAFTFTFG